MADFLDQKSAYPTLSLLSSLFFKTNLMILHMMINKMMVKSKPNIDKNGFHHLIFLIFYSKTI
ncbi:hypothetical protein HPAG1_0881 [Helicobacter pylori HPAG1]|nr:hypothetical protein HPAG1_0881 [Helicobacter pylori HPAG1]